jgi:transposase, IS6 family
MRALRKGQASIFNITRDMRSEARLVERAFGLGPSALAEAMQFVTEQLCVTPMVMLTTAFRRLC